MKYLILCIISAASSFSIATERLGQVACARLLIHARTPSPEFEPLLNPVVIDTTAIQSGKYAVISEVINHHKAISAEGLVATEKAQDVIFEVNEELWAVGSRELDKKLNHINFNELAADDKATEGHLVQDSLSNLEQAFSNIFHGRGNQLLNANVRFIAFSEANLPIVETEPLLNYLMGTSGEERNIGQSFIIQYGNAPKSGESSQNIFVEYWAEWSGPNKFTVKSASVHLGDLKRFVPKE